MNESNVAQKRDKARVLFIDDEHYYTQSYVDELVDAGYEVTTADSVPKTLRLLADHEYEVAIVDVMMKPSAELGSMETWGGRRTGLALARRIREQLPRVRVVGLVCSRPAGRARLV